LATDNTEDSELLFGSSICERLEKFSKENKLKSLLDKDTHSGIKRKREHQPTSSNKWLSYKTQKKANTSNGQFQNNYIQQQPKQKSPKLRQKKSNTQTRTPEAVMQEVRYIEELKQYLKHKVQNFKAGSVRNHVIQWKGVTTDIELLQTISGLYIPANYISTAPNKSYPIEK